MEKTVLQRAIEALENAGFHVDRANEENNRDVGNPNTSYSRQESLTGAICLRITPLEKPVFSEKAPEIGGMTDYSKTVIEHSLTALTEKSKKEVQERLQDSYTAFFRLKKILERDMNSLYHGYGHPEGMREDMAAIVFCAAAMLYEWDKTRLPPSLISDSVIQ
jgi:hypothetical protein